MRIHIKAALLSAFVLPGLGQLHKQDRVKGIILILLVNIFLLSALFFVMQGMGQLILDLKISGAADAARVVDALQKKSPAARTLLKVFLVLWAYGVTDALLARGNDRDDRKED